ncbi:MAG: cation:proton antiporter [Spirochaetales bacterium]|uniref:Cation:proton antiporter n=1 Tax=Candidatus Thalassospirochaeta sargassi TaxID=3119039 RepID=A0AAJ1IAN6_9SPIO|nr:cation:proton antiporter [Spirochaetales bacterium]
MSLNLILAIIILGGWLFSRLFKIIKLPNILGMVIFGIIIGSTIGKLIPGTLWDIEPLLKSLALIVILLRAGLGLSKATLQKAGRTAVLMTFVPCLLEGGALTLLFYHFFVFDWYVAGLTAFMIAAVSPAVIVPSMLDLIEQGYGKKNEVPSIVLAGASADDVFAITLFSVFLGLAATAGVDIGRALISIPLSIAGGVISGIVAGWLLVKYFRRRHQHVRATEKTLVLIMVAVLLVQLGDKLHVAALLGVMTVGFILLERAEYIAHELAAKLKKVWIFAEIILFVLIGMSVDVPTALSAGLRGLMVIAIGLVFRSFGVFLSTLGSSLNLKERIFCIIAYLPKATVQAALGSVALQAGVAEGEIILALAVLSIIFTAPLGLIGIKVFGKRLLELDL